MKNQDKIFKEITDQIIANLETAKKWDKPWNAVSEAPSNAISGKNYKGINWLILSLSKYSNPQWLTYKQAKELGGNVKKGEKGTQIIYFKMLLKEDKDGNETKFPMTKTYSVFNIEQCENLKTDKIKNYDPSENIDIHASQSSIKELIKQLNVELHHGGDRAFFDMNADYIKMPYTNTFKSIEHYDSTLLHELTHWTGHEKRLNRKYGKSFGSKDYAFEELVAELGSAMAGSILGLSYEGLQHEEYIASWLEALKGDIKYIYDASKLSQKAVNYMIENSKSIQLKEVA